MKREALDQWCERGILVLVLAILVFLPLAFGGRSQPAVGHPVVDFLSGVPFLIAEWLSIAVVVLWLCRLWINPTQRWLCPPICWAVLAFVLYAIARYLTADIEYVARQELIRILVYALLFFAIVNNLHRQETVHVIVLTLIALAMAISVYAVFQFLTNSDRVWHLTKPYPHRGTGTYIYPNNLGGLLEMILPLGLAYTLVGRTNPVVRVFLGYASLVILAGIGVTLSRGTWVSTVVALCLFFSALLFHRSHRLPALVVGLILLIGGIYVLKESRPLQDRLKQLTQNKHAAEGRTDIWPAAVNIWRENVWWGVGPAHFDYRFREFRPETVQSRPDRAHNDFLNTLVDWGIAGAVLVASAWILLALGVLKTWRFVRGAPRDIGGKKNSNKFAYVLGATAGLAAILIHSTVDYNMHVPANAVIAVSLMALLSSHLRFATDRYWFRIGAVSKVAASILILGSVAYLGAQSWRRARESVWIEKAAVQALYSPEQAACLKQAFAIEPKNWETAMQLGESLRFRSDEGGSDYRQLAQEALVWFDRSAKLNPWDPRPPLGAGHCLDWLGRTGEAGPYFWRAEELDPNGYFTLATIGKRYVDLGDFAAARPWFNRSLQLQGATDNEMATNYLAISNQRLLEAAAATNEFRLKLEGATPTR
jgi:O-antigen ligase